MTVDVDSPAALALRALQKYDQAAPQRGTDILLRPLLIEAQDALGGLLGLECTGEDEGGGHCDHGGDTCPIHEWLVEGDAAIAERLEGSITPA